MSPLRPAVCSVTAPSSPRPAGKPKPLEMLHKPGSVTGYGEQGRAATQHSTQSQLFSQKQPSHSHQVISVP